MIANVLVGTFGQVALPFTAVLLIPFDLVTRDLLHERWSKRGAVGLWSRMATLILMGSILSAVFNWSILQIATASFVAFLFAGMANAIVYSAMPNSTKFIRMNVSNFGAAWTDSVVFPLIAFPSVDWWLVSVQACSKFIGGIVLTWIFLALLKRNRKEQVDEDN